MYQSVSLTDSAKRKPLIIATRNTSRLLRRKKAKQVANKTLTHQYTKNLSGKVLSDNELNLLSNGLKYIPTPPRPASHFPLLRDFKTFSRTLRLNYLFADSNTKKHPFYVKSTWQPPPQPSVHLRLISN